MKHIKPYRIFESQVEPQQHPGFPKSREEIKKICDRYSIYNYTINEDLSIDVNNNSVNLSYNKLSFLPLKFNEVEYNFSCNECGLLSLEGSPNKVGHEFIVNDNKLTNLKYRPEHIGTRFFCRKNEITDLKYFPKYVGGNIFFEQNPIDTLIYTFIHKDNAENLVQEFNDFSIVRDDTVVLNRLKSFINDFDLDMPDLNEVKKYYKII